MLAVGSPEGDTQPAAIMAIPHNSSKRLIMALSLGLNEAYVYPPKRRDSVRCLT
jgi:hypothetical protein